MLASGVVAGDLKKKFRAEMEGSHHTMTACDDFCVRMVWTMTFALAVAFLAVVSGGLFDLSVQAERVLVR